MVRPSGIHAMSRSALPSTAFTSGSIFLESTSICLIQNSPDVSRCTKLTRRVPGIRCSERPMLSVAMSALPIGTFEICQCGGRAKHEERDGFRVHPGVIADRLHVAQHELRAPPCVSKRHKRCVLSASVRTTLNPPGVPKPAGRGVGEFSFSAVCVSCETRPVARSNT